MRIATVALESTPVGTDSFQSFEGSTAVGGGGSVARSTSVLRSTRGTGAASRQHDSGGSSALAYSDYLWGLLGSYGYYARAYFRVDSLPTGTVRIMYLSDNSTPLAGARLTSGGKIQLWNETGTPAQIGSDSSATIAVDTWYRLEVYCKTLSGAGDDECELRLDGTTVASQSAMSLGTSMVTRVFFGWLNGPGASKSIYFDDLVVNDDQGGVNDSWPGAGGVAYLFPTGDNARGANWTAGAGGTSNLYAAVDSIVPTTGVATGSATDTTQIRNTNTADTTGNYDADMQSYTTAGFIAEDTIQKVQTVMLGGSSDTTYVTSAMQVVSNPAQGSEDSKLFGRGAAVGTFGSNWATHYGTAQDSPSVTLGTQPVVRVGRRGTESGAVHISAMLLAVDYLEGTPASGSILFPHRVV